jgi:hypothetical protein
MKLKVGRLYKWAVPFRSDCAVTVTLREVIGEIVLVEYNGERYPASTAYLSDTHQFEQGDVVRYGAGWSLRLYEVDTRDARSGEILYYLRPLNVDEDGNIASNSGEPLELRSESDIVAVKHYHVFGLYGDDTSRWSRALWAKDAQEAEDVCREELGDELEIAATLRINGTIDEQH